MGENSKSLSFGRNHVFNVHLSSTKFAFPSFLFPRFAFAVFFLHFSTLFNFPFLIFMSIPNRLELQSGKQARSRLGRGEQV